MLLVLRFAQKKSECRRVLYILTPTPDASCATRECATRRAHLCRDVTDSVGSEAGCFGFALIQPTRRGDVDLA